MQVYRDPGEAEIPANWFTFSATSRMVTVEMRKAIAQPLPANPNTVGTVMTGAPVGAMRATDWAKISLGDRAAASFRRKTMPETLARTGRRVLPTLPVYCQLPSKYTSIG